MFRAALALILYICALPLPSLAVTICGYVGERIGPNGGYDRDVSVILQPSGAEVLANHSGIFCFSGVTAGSYTLSVTPQCNEYGCRAVSTSIVVGTTDIHDLFIPNVGDSGEGGPGGLTCERVPPLSCPTNSLTGAFDLDVTFIEQLPRYRKFGVFDGEFLGTPKYTLCSTPRCTATSGPYPYCKDVPGMPLPLSPYEVRGPFPTTATNESEGCPGLDGDFVSPEGTSQNAKRWPTVGETLRYKAHIKNKGTIASPSFVYIWYKDHTQISGESGTHAGIPAGGEVIIDLECSSAKGCAFPTTPQNIEILIFVPSGGVDAHSENNSLSVNSHAFSISWWVDDTIYDQFNARLSPMTNTQSFEDWLQANIAYMNKQLAEEALYLPEAPSGAAAQVRIDRITVTSDVGGDEFNDKYGLCVDGRWQTAEDDCYVCEKIDRVDFGLTHEVYHQLSQPHEESFDPALFGVKTEDGATIPTSSLPPVYRGPGGDMGGAEIYPFEESGWHCKGGANSNGICGDICPDGVSICIDPLQCGSGYECQGPNFPSRHTVGNLQNAFPPGKTPARRGYFGEYQWDTPATTYVRVLDDSGVPVSGAVLKLYQENPCTYGINNTPEITTGPTDSLGIVVLPNRPVSPVGVYNPPNPTPSLVEPTGSGHQLRPNPFGQIYEGGVNRSLMFVKVIPAGGGEFYRWLKVSDLNLAYWAGNTSSAVITLGKCASRADADADQVRDECDNCPGIANSSQADADYDGLGDLCDSCPYVRAIYQCVPSVAASADAWVGSTAPSANHGSDTTLSVGRGISSKGGSTPSIDRAFMSFGLHPTVPSNATITQAS